MGHLKSFFKGVVLGGLVGVATGLFSAPKKGEELKKEAQKAMGELIKKGKKLQKDINPKVKQVVRGAKKAEKIVVKSGKKVVTKARKIAKKYKK